MEASKLGVRYKSYLPIFLGAALLRAVSFSQTPLILETADLDADGIFLHRLERPFFVSPFSEWENLRLVQVKAGYTWTPTLRETGTNSATLRAYRESQTVYFALGSQADLKLGRQRTSTESSLKDSASYAADLRSNRRDFPFGVLYHLVKPTGMEPGLDLLLDFHAVEKLDYTLGFDWCKPSDSQQPKLTRLQFLQSFRDGTDAFDFQDLRPDGTGENVHATYNSRRQSSSAFLEVTIGPGILGGNAVYAWTKPILPRTEYGLTDSSQTLRLALSFRAPQTLGSLWYAYEEGSLRTMGLRVPPGSEGSKRFHYALTTTRLHEMRMESPGHAFFGNETTSVELAGNWLTVNSAPQADAVLQHKETLSYNRLGLSFIADIYGGFSRNGELIKVNGTLRQIEWTPRQALGFSKGGISGRGGPRGIYSGLKLDFSLPMALSWIDFEISGETVDQGVFATTIDRAYAFGRTGRILSATPRLSGEWSQPFWEEAVLRLGGKVSQVLLLWNDLEGTHPLTVEPIPDPGGPGGGAPAGPKTAYPLWENGFLGEISMAMDF